MAEKILIKNGEAFAFPEENIDAAIKAGYRHESVSEAETRADKNFANSATGTALATVAGAVRGATVGLSDIGASLLDDAFVRSMPVRVSEPVRPATEMLQLLKENNPVASLAGEITGIVGPAILSAGAAVPAMAAARLGTSVAARVTARLGGSAAARIAGITGGALIEGAVFDVGRAASEAALENTKLTAEKIIGHIGQGGLWNLFGGAAAGTLIEGVGLVAKGASKTADALKKGVKSKPAIALMDRASELSAKMSGASAESIKKFTALGEEGRQVRKAIAHGEQIKDSLVRELTSVMDDSMKITNKLTPETLGGMKKSRIAEVVGGDLDSAYIYANTILRDQAAKIKQMKSGIKKGYYGSPGAIRTAEKTLDGARMRIFKMYKSGAADGKKMTEIFAELDMVKQHYGHLAKPGFMVTSNAAGATVKHFDKEYYALREILEDSEYFGNAAVLQKDVNKGYTSWLGQKDFFDKKFTTEVGTEAFRPVRRANPAAIEAHVNKLTKPSSDLDHKILVDHMRSQAELIKKLQKNYKLSDPNAARKMQSLLKRFNAAMEKLEGNVALSNEYKAMVQAGSNNVGGIIGGGVGYAVAGIPGAAAGVAMHALSNPAGIVRKMIAIENAAAPMSARIADGVVEFLNPIKDAAKRALPKTGIAANRIVDAIARPEKNTDDQERMQRFVAAASNPTALAQRAVESVRKLNLDDATAQYVAEHAVRTAQFLASKAPRVDAGVGGMKVPSPISRMAMQRFRAYQDAAERPEMIARDFGNKKMTPIQAEVLRTIYPEMHAEFSTAVLEQVALMKRKLTARERMQLTLLLGQRKATPLILRQHQAAATQQAQAQSPMRNARIDIDTESEMTRAERLLRR